MSDHPTPFDTDAEKERLQNVMDVVYRAFTQSEIEQLEGQPHQWTLQITDVNGKRTKHMTFQDLINYMQEQDRANNGDR